MDTPDLSPSSFTPALPIAVRAVTVKHDRLVCEVGMPDARYRFSTPQLAQQVLDAYPTLAQHACVNLDGAPLADALATTSLPHVLEHIAIDIQTHASNDPDASFVGTTEWLDEDAGIARIELSFADDLEAVRAFSEAVQFLNRAVLTCSPW